MDGKKTKKALFEALTVDEIKDWAGSKIFSRGQDYFKSNLVRELSVAPSDDLVAWVKGTRTYAVHLSFSEGDLTAVCNCPYDDTCKHAVAVLLKYLDCMKKKAVLPAVGKDDERLRRANENWTSDEDEPIQPYRQRAPRKASSDTLKKFLDQQSREELIDLLEDIVSRIPEAGDHLAYRREIASGNTNKIVETIKKEIRVLSAEPGWRDHWRHEGYTPDYSRVRERLETLLQQGYSDEVVDIGKELLERGNGQIEMTDDEGETADEIAECMDVIFNALSKSSRPAVERLLWAIDTEINDEYGVCRGTEVFFRKLYAAADWNAVADSLAKRLTEYHPAKGEDRFLRSYKQDRLTDWIIRALDHAGRKDEVIPLCEREAGKTASYVRLVNRLIAARRWKDAEHWIREGIAKTDKQWPGIAEQLRGIFRNMREQDGDWGFVAALRAADFFRDPSLRSFQELQKAARKGGGLPEIRAAVMAYLETGQQPAQKAWPLPETGLPEPPDRRPRQAEFPLCDVLIDIAIAEKKPADIIRWHDHKQGKRSSYLSTHREDAVAAAIAATCPDRAVAIWKKLAENQISLTKPSAYQEAGGYLRKIKTVLSTEGKDADWKGYAEALRSEHKRKIRFIEILDKLI